MLPTVRVCYSLLLEKMRRHHPDVPFQFDILKVPLDLHKKSMLMTLCQESFNLICILDLIYKHGSFSIICFLQMYMLVTAYCLGSEKSKVMNLKIDPGIRQSSRCLECWQKSAA